VDKGKVNNEKIECIPRSVSRRRTDRGASYRADCEHQRIRPNCHEDHKTLREWRRQVCNY